MRFLKTCSPFLLFFALVLTGCSDSSLTAPDAPDAPADSPSPSVWVNLDVSGPNTVAPGDYATWTMTDNGTATLSQQRWYVQPTYPFDDSYYCGTNGISPGWMCADFSGDPDALTLSIQGSDGSTFYIQAEAVADGETVRSPAYAVQIDSGSSGGDDDDGGSCDPMTPCTSP